MEYKDFRSDTVTKPCAAMRKAMAEAEVGDDVYGDDPSVNALQEYGAALLGKEAALFASSGTQSNLLALLTHLGRGDEYIVGQDAHTYKMEGGGAAVFGSIQPQPIEFEEDGSLGLAKVEAKIKPEGNIHYARTQLLCLENTQDGKVLSLDYQAKAAAFVKERGLRLHLDGARVFNAAVKLKVGVQEISRHYETVSVCLSKGLGAPIGSILCGPKEFIKRALRWRKVLGGGMRQAGIVAAGGLYALRNNIPRLAEDHENAEFLTKGLREMPEIEALPHSGETNMVFIRLREKNPQDLSDFLKARGILMRPDKNPIRIVVHLDLNRADMRALLDGIKDFFTNR
ncbi:MAG: low-specificity L-threonine aldolase [Spirochaetia bacterium]|jgi:threonine aldolase|nr:low-specificity L-threonine aldolase [Spirochaetia bacterium]